MMHWALLAVLFVVHADAARIHHQNHEIVSKPSTEEIFAVFDSVTGISYNPYSKHHPGRHVCTNQKDSAPMKIKQTFAKPTYKKYLQRCNNNQICSGVKIVYETDTRDITANKPIKNHNYVCCPGWKQINNRSYGCNKPICSDGCLNGGGCVKPDTCLCKKGFKGYTCEYDVDECRDEKPCDQICINIPGSYKCQCRENYGLHEDGQTCTRDDDEPGVEAKEMEFETLDQKVHSLETVLEVSKNETEHQLKIIADNMEYINEDISKLKTKFNDAELFKTDFNIFRTKLHQLEKKSSKIDELSARYDRMKKCAFYNKICL